MFIMVRITSKVQKASQWIQRSFHGNESGQSQAMKIAKG